MNKSREPKVAVARAQALGRRVLWRVTDNMRLTAPHQNSSLRLRPPDDGNMFRIVFLVCESAKWTHQALFEALATVPEFSVSFVLTLSDVAQRMHPKARAQHHARQMAAFSQFGTVSDTLFLQSDRVRDPRSLRADLIFVQQPWGMQDLPRRLAGLVSCAHISYELGVINAPKQQYAIPDFHPWLWRLFVPSQQHMQMLQAAKNLIAAEQVVVSGSPRLAEWPRQLQATAKFAGTNPQQVVWAPHHSIVRKSLRLGTFAWSAPCMLSLARANPQIRFVLRPHPNLWHMLDSQKKSAAEIFKMNWLALPNTLLREDGDALPILLQADALITDSASFLAEFMLSGRPILRLSRPDSASLSEFGLALAPGFYNCSEPERLEQAFQQVILDGQDPLRKLRAELATQFLTLRSTDPAAVIRDEILNDLRY